MSPTPPLTGLHNDIGNVSSFLWWTHRHTHRPADPFLRDLHIHLWRHSRCSWPVWHSNRTTGRARERLWRKNGFVNGGIQRREGFSTSRKKSLERHEHLHTFTASEMHELNRVREPSDDLHFCIERFTVLHRFFLSWLKYKLRRQVILSWFESRSRGKKITKSNLN